MKMMHGVRLPLLEEVTNTRGADTDEHLDEIEPDIEKNGRPPRPRPLARSVFRSRRTDEERALRQTTTETAEALGIRGTR